MNRRGILGGLGLGGVAAATGIRADAPAMVGQLGQGAWSSDCPRPVEYRPSPMQLARDAAERQLWQGRHRARRRQEIMIGLAGPFPLHLASMNSCKPWFLAQRAAVFLEAKEAAEENWFQQQLRSIAGDT